MIHYCFLTGLYSRKDPLMIERQGRSLVLAGYKVSYVCCDGQKDELSEGIQIYSSGFIPRNRIHRLLFTKRHLLKKAIELDADIYQISDPELLGIVRQLKKMGKKIVFNLREYYPDLIFQKKYIPTIFRGVISRFYDHTMTRFLPLYDAVFTVTNQFVDFLNERHGVNKAYLLTNYPIPDSSFSLSREEYMARPNMLFYEGSIYLISRQEIVFDALSELEDVGYCLAGKIEPGYESIKNHPYWTKVSFIDGFKKEDLKGLFKKATISNVLRDWGKLDGSLGVIKLFESMEAALPVLLPDVPTYKLLIEKYHCGLCVNPNNRADVKSAIAYLINNKEEAYKMGQNGRRAVMEEFNWSKQAETYLKVINEIYQS